MFSIKLFNFFKASTVDCVFLKSLENSELIKGTVDDVGFWMRKDRIGLNGIELT